MRTSLARVLFIAFAILGGACSDRKGNAPSGFERTRAGDFVSPHVAAEVFTTVDARGATVTTPGDAGRAHLHVARFGRPGALTPVGSAAPEEHDGRVTILRAPGVREWFARVQGGIEHGVDLAERPTGEGPLVLEVAVEGATAVPASAGTIALRDAAGAPSLSYGALAAKDGDGRDLDAEMRAHDGVIDLRIDDRGAHYPISVDPLLFGQQTELVAGEGNDELGTSVAVSGSTAVLGGYNSTTAYVFTRSGSTWTQQATLVPSDPEGGDGYGQTIAVSGDTAVVGALSHTVGSNTSQGAAYVFTRSGSTWTQQAMLVASDGLAGDLFGKAVALSGDTAVISAYGKTVGANENQGVAYVFARSGSTWTQQATLVASDGLGGDLFGFSVALDGATAIVGAIYHTVSRPGQGVAYVFSGSGAAWTQQAELVAADGVAEDQLGNSVAISGGTAVVGASLKSADQGAAYVFAANGATWTQQAKLIESDGAGFYEFGLSVAVSGSTVVVGSQGNATGSAAYVFAANGATWTQQQEFPSGTMTDTGFGNSVAVSGGTLIVGAPYITNANGAVGAAFAYALAHGNGDPCTAPADCASLFCVDGVCCLTACTEACQACSAAAKGEGADGTCGAVVAGAVDPHDICTAAAVSTCGQTGACNGLGACADFAAGTVCAPEGCSGASSTAASTCDGQGTCVAAGTAVCAPGYVCVGAACATSCTDDGACATGYTCSGGVCTALADAGADGGALDGGADAGAIDGGEDAGAVDAGAGGDAVGDAGTGGSTMSATGDAGTGGADTGGSGSQSPAARSGCNCRAAGGDEGGSPSGTLVLAGLALTTLRRRRASAA